jgi:Icc-related predicted phosphoesterase
MVRLAAVSDIHFGRTSVGALHALFTRIVESADVLLLCGDLTDTGNPEEGRGLAHELSGLKIPMVGVLGNHDYECNRVDELKQALHEGGIRILDGDAEEILGIGVAGVKGFAGGFGRGALGPWGEPAIKAFVRRR